MTAPEHGSIGRTPFEIPYLTQLLFTGHRKWPTNESGQRRWSRDKDKEPGKREAKTKTAWKWLGNPYFIDLGVKGRTGLIIISYLMRFLGPP